MGGNVVPEHFFHRIIYVLISGYTELLPVSAYPHQTLYEKLTGLPMTDSIVSLALRFGVLLALVVACFGRLKRIHRESRHARRSRKRRTRHVDHYTLVDTQVIRTAMLIAILGLFLYGRLDGYLEGLHWLVILLVANGFVVFLPRITASGNKNSLSVSRLDSLLLGTGGILGMIPGFSKLGTLQTAAHLRGVDRTYALDVALIICIPLYLGLLIIDSVAVFSAGFSISGITILGYGLLALISFGAAYLSIMVMRYYCSKAGFLSFSYYSWALAMFTFVLYLLIQ
jgi:undecaprenyl pyrophosphate phosphatase UppP